MQTLEALLGKKVPDDYMENYKKVIQSNTSSKELASDSDNCEEPMKNGGRPVLSPVLVSKGLNVNSDPLSVGEPPKAATNGVKSHGFYRLIARKPSDASNNHLSNAPLQFKAFNGSSLPTTNGNIRLVPGANGTLKDETFFKTPLSILNTEPSRKKVRMSTVPKHVPLINTVGNQSKLHPFLAQAQSPTTVVPVNGAVLETSVSTSSVPKCTDKPMSILEARLKGPASNVPVAVSSPQACNGTEPVPSENGVADTVESESSESSKLLKNLRTYNLKKIPVTVNSSRSKAVLSFEKGTTRLAAAKSRPVTMVDIGIQVYIPNIDEQTPEGNESCPQAQLPSLQAFSAGLSGSVQPAATSPAMTQKQFVVLDVKNGKRVLAIQKQVVSNVSTVPLSTLSGHGNVVTVVSSLSSDTMTTPSQGQLSITTPIPTVGHSSSAVPAAFTQKNNVVPSMQTATVLSASHKISSDSVVLPLNGGFFVKNSSDSSKLFPLSQTCLTSPQQFSGSRSDSLILPLNSPIAAPPFRRSSDNGSVHTLPNTTSLFILVPNSMNQAATPKSEELDHESGEIPGVEEFVKRQIGYKRKDELSDVYLNPPKKRCTESRNLKNDSLNMQSIETEPASGTGGVILKSNNRHQNIPETVGKVFSDGNKVRNSPGNNSSNIISNASGAPHTASREEVDKFVKNAFTDFKNCLVFDKEGRLPIHAAVENNDLAAVKRQCIVLKARRASMNTPNSKDETPLQLALYHGYSSIAELLLLHGANTKVFDQDGNSALHLAVIHAEGAVEAILRSGQLDEGDINCMNDEGFSALHLAAQHEKVNAIERLIHHGAKVDLPDGKSGRTALFHAVERKNYRAQKALLSCGADMKEPTFAGATPFLLTKTDAIAQLSGQDMFVEIIDSDTLLKSTRRYGIGKVK